MTLVRGPDDNVPIFCPFLKFLQAPPLTLCEIAARQNETLLIAELLAILPDLRLPSVIPDRQLGFFSEGPGLWQINSLVCLYICGPLLTKIETFLNGVECLPGAELLHLKLSV